MSDVVRAARNGRSANARHLRAEFKIAFPAKAELEIQIADAAYAVVG